MLAMCQPPYQPRRPSGADSTRNATELGVSPPVENPCPSRRSNSDTGARTPIADQGGRNAIAEVATAIIAIMRLRAGRRPR